MSFNANEISRAKGEKITLYEFGPINGTLYRYTDSEIEVARRGDLIQFEPVPIERGAISSSGSLDRSALDITMPKTLEIADHFRAYPPEGQINVIIREFHRNDSSRVESTPPYLFLEVADALVAWTGRILSVAWDANELKFTCEPFSTAMRRSGLRRNYQFGCPHVLYGDKCRATPWSTWQPQYAPVDKRMEVVSIDKNVIELNPGWNTFYAPGSPHETVPPSVDSFVGGVFSWSYFPIPSQQVRFRRTVLRVESTNFLTLSGIPTGLTVGNVLQQNVSLLLGCNHQMSDCSALHNNIINFGGQPWIPLKTPFGAVNNYY